jgi:hypothetical protein
MPLVNKCRIGRLDASTEEKKKYAPPNFRPGCLSATYQTGTRFTILRKRKEGASTPATFLSGEDTQLRVGRRKGRESAMVRNLVSGCGRRVESAILG